MGFLRSAAGSVHRKTSAKRYALLVKRDNLYLSEGLRGLQQTTRGSMARLQSLIYPNGQGRRWLSWAPDPQALQWQGGLCKKGTRLLYLKRFMWQAGSLCMGSLSSGSQRRLWRQRLNI